MKERVNDKKTQTACIIKSNKKTQAPEILAGQAYTDREKRINISVLYSSRKTFRLIKSLDVGIRLAGESTIGQWTMAYKCQPGHTNETFILLHYKKMSFTNSLDLNVSIMFDGMATRNVSNVTRLEDVDSWILKC